MKAQKKVMVFSILLTLIVLPGFSFAEDLAVHYSILSSERDGMILRGAMRVEVRNLTNGDLRNVDLRLPQPGIKEVENGLFQLGSIPDNEARIVIGGFLFEEALIASGEPIIWQVDYDGAEGNHKQIMLPGIEEDP